MRRLFARHSDCLEAVDKETREYLRCRLQKPGDQVWIRASEIKVYSYGQKYYDYILMRKTITGRIEEVDRKHFDPDDDDFFQLL